MSSNIPRMLNLTEVALRLDMRKTNVAKFLARHGIEPDLAKAQGYLWAEDKIEALKAKHDADTERRESDRKRREAALRNVNGTGPKADGDLPVDGHRLGPTERAVLVALLVRPRLTEQRHRHAARRLRDRGLVERVAGEQQTYRLTERGREAAGQL